MEVTVKFRTNHMRRALFLFLLAIPIAFHAQSPTDYRGPIVTGRHTVSGIIFTTERRPAGRGIPIRLSSGTNDFTAWTDQDGKFAINGVGNGTYTLTADVGDEYEPLRERVEIVLPRNATAQIFYVDLRMRSRLDAKTPPGVIDARMAGVPKRAQQHYQDAVKAMAKSDTQSAIDKLLLAVAEFPEFTAAHTELGTQYQKIDQFEKSEKHQRIALKLEPGAYEPLASLGVVLVRLGKHAEAETVLRDAVKIKDESAVVRFYLGRSLLSQKKFDEAEPEFRAALSKGGKEMIEARRSLANIYLQRADDKKALEELEAYLAADTKPADEKKLRETVRQLKEILKEKTNP
jgi:Tfp pilus assembly protein PilF